MSSAPSQHPLLSARRPWWQPIVALAISLYGLVVDGWGMQAIVFLFWWETILIIFSGYLRVLFALDGKPVLATVPIKLVTLAFGVVMGGAMIALAVVFSIEGMTSPGDDSVGSTRVESSLLLAIYALGLLFHYFLNGRFRTANPAGEMYASLAHVLVLLVIIMPITQHLLPKYPHLDRAVWVAGTVVVAKFLCDLVYTRYQDSMREFIKV